MNIKQFLIFKVCDVLPPELKYYILNMVKDEAAICIQRFYMFKVAKNLDIFYIISQLAHPTYYNLDITKNIIKYSYFNTTYEYIQAPHIWYALILTIYNKYMDKDYPEERYYKLIIDKIVKIWDKFLLE